ncbi:MAG: hypothetical protein NVS1B4_20240 [Gemmatimonadaceae bacterium]
MTGTRFVLSPLRLFFAAALARLTSHPGSASMKFAKLAGLGAFAATLGFVAAYALLLYISLPVATGGIDRILFAVVAVSSAVVFILLGAVHLAIGKQLLDSVKS